jgi:hypothetical protein
MRDRDASVVVIFQNVVILFADLFIIRFRVIFGILPKSFGLLEKMGHNFAIPELWSYE